MPYVIGIVLSAGVAVFARFVGFDRDRAFYPTVMIVIASYYVLFAVMSGSVQTVVIESVVMTLFAAAAVAGFKSSAWIVVVALAGHGVFDAVHGHVFEFAVAEASPQLLTQLLELAFVKRQVVVFKVDDAIALTVTQLDFGQHVVDAAAPIGGAKGRMHRAERAFVRATSGRNHERQRLPSQIVLRCWGVTEIWKR